jgi:hypothetical protein
VVAQLQDEADDDEDDEDFIPGSEVEGDGLDLGDEEDGDVDAAVCVSRKELQVPSAFTATIATDAPKIVRHLPRERLAMGRVADSRQLSDSRIKPVATDFSWPVWVFYRMTSSGAASFSLRGWRCALAGSRRGK